MLLVGVACSNVFDGQRNLEGLVLKGVTHQGEVGYLTALEKYKYLEVGQYFKHPKVPVWVVCFDSHFTVLFR